MCVCVCVCVCVSDGGNAHVQEVICYRLAHNESFLFTNDEFIATNNNCTYYHTSLS